MILLLFSLPFLPYSVSLQTSCFVKEQQCEISADNLIETLMGVPTFGECRALCDDEISCAAFTHFRENSCPISNGCFLFSSCTEKRQCGECTTGLEDNSCPCSIRYSGLITADNLVGVWKNLGEVTNEFDCQKACIANDLCKVYTFYDGQDPQNPNVCFLLNGRGLQKPVVPCQHCATGPAHCQANQTCQVAVLTNGTHTQHFFAEENTTITLVAGDRDCFSDISIFAIGGGGGYGYYNNVGGGGSGYVEAKTVQLSTDSPVLKVAPGGFGEASRVEMNGELVIHAAPGGTPDAQGGGDGFSGGGGVGGMPKGGSNGGDGEDGEEKAGGRGSGFDLSSFAMASFLLTPGEGGEANRGEGGGGGGVVVNGKKPGDFQYNGQGYGGGGSYAQRDGYSGCVLVEI